MGNVLPDIKDAERLVTVTHDGETVEALWDPGFIIKKGDKYFLTLAVWEYEQAPGETVQQQEGVAEVIHLFNMGLKDGKLLAAVPVADDVDRFPLTQIRPIH